MTSLKQDTTELVRRFADAAHKQWELIDRGDSEAANRYFDDYTRIYVELKRRGRSDLDQLLQLLDWPDPAVRMAAGGYALEFVPERAEPVLEGVCAEPGTIGFNARMTLQEGRAGPIRFPFRLLTRPRHPPRLV